jgi:glycosyltransferase involved in cell wall biosynthesis
MGRQRIVEKFNWQTTAKQTLAIYTEAIALQKHQPSN